MQTIQVHVGEPMRTVLAGNERANFDPKKIDDDVPIIWPVDDSIPQIFDVTYNDPGGPIHFPHARMVWAKQFAGVVTDVLVSASEKKIPLPALYNELKDAAAQLQSAGWSTKAPLPSLNTLQAALNNSGGPGIGGGVATYTKGSVSALLSIKAFSVSAADGAYVLDVQFADDALHQAQEKKAYEERLRVNGTIDKSLPLSYWLERAR